MDGGEASFAHKHSPLLTRHPTRELVGRARNQRPSVGKDVQDERGKDNSASVSRVGRSPRFHATRPSRICEGGRCSGAKVRLGCTRKPHLRAWSLVPGLLVHGFVVVSTVRSETPINTKVACALETIGALVVATRCPASLPSRKTKRRSIAVAAFGLRTGSDATSGRLNPGCW